MKNIRVKSVVVVQCSNLEEFFASMPLQSWYVMTWKYFQKSTSSKDGEKICGDTIVRSKRVMSCIVAQMNKGDIRKYVTVLQRLQIWVEQMLKVVILFLIGLKMYRKICHRQFNAEVIVWEFNSEITAWEFQVNEVVVTA